MIKSSVGIFIACVFLAVPMNSFAEPVFSKSWVAFVNKLTKPILQVHGWVISPSPCAKPHLGKDASTLHSVDSLPLTLNFKSTVRTCDQRKTPTAVSYSIKNFAGMNSVQIRFPTGETIIVDIKTIE